jgi:hypothetical protein
VQAASEYEALRKALAHSGLDPEHLRTLTQTSLVQSPIISPEPSPFTSSTPSVATSIAASPVKEVEAMQQVTASPRKTEWCANAPIFVPKRKSSPKFEQDEQKVALMESRSNWRAPSPSGKSTQNPQRPLVDSSVDKWPMDEVQGDRYEEDYDESLERDGQDRTIIIRGLAPFTTLADLAGIIRGGIVLNMHIRSRDRAAIVSFVDPMAAEKFIMHSRRNDIYLKGKRLQVAWAERQYSLPAYVSRQVQQKGVTRNIVVRFAKKEMTEQTIREDLEHIHKLEIVKIITTCNHIFISTNGIELAITARHCMRSRLTYQGTRIEFFEDECDQIIPVLEKKIFKKQTHEFGRPATMSMANRFALLFHSEDGSTDGAGNGQSCRRIVSSNDFATPA